MRHEARAERLPRAASLLIFVLSVFFERAAWAEGSSNELAAPIVVVAVGSCSNSPSSEAFVAALRVELLSLPIDAYLRLTEPGTPSGECVLVRASRGLGSSLTSRGHSVACHVLEEDLRVVRVAAEPCDLEQGRLLLQIDVPGHELQRYPLDLSDAPVVARARMAAVGLVETLHWLLKLNRGIAKGQRAEDEATTIPQLTSPPKTRTSVEGNHSHAADANPGARARRRPGRLRTGGGLEVAVIGTEKTAAWGGFATADVRMYGRWRLQMDLEYLRSEVTTALGLATLDWFGALAGPDLTLVAIPEIRLGARVAVARAIAQGESRLGYAERSHGAWAALLLISAQLRAELGHSLGLRPIFEVGHSLHAPQFTAGGEPSFLLAGYWGRSRVVVDWEF